MEYFLPLNGYVHVWEMVMHYRNPGSDLQAKMGHHKCHRSVGNTPYHLHGSSTTAHCCDMCTMAPSLAWLAGMRRRLHNLNGSISGAVSNVVYFNYC